MKKHNPSFFTSKKQNSLGSSDEFYQSFIKGETVGLLPFAATPKHKPAHSLLEKSLVSVTKEGFEHQFHHKLPRTTAGLTKVVEIFEMKSNYLERQEKSLQAGKGKSESSVCAAVSTGIETSAKIVSYAALGASSRGLSFMQTAATYGVTSPLIEKATEKVGDLSQRACHSTYSLGRSAHQRLSTPSQADQKAMPPMRKF